MNEIERVVLDALWPVLGGNHTDAETWQKISDAVTAAIAAMGGEPVAWMYEKADLGRNIKVLRDFRRIGAVETGWTETALYAGPTPPDGKGETNG